ncbi:uncharacterized protein LOC132341370 isoform X2 [Haemorhous mexicanus]|uniref:uncharacterized protein LOC132341370 isoform X2 n=1 Tax=Haemorhous mexicanus TaxID=30427 RepID=UPI0028BD9014|nr:uncharacterized protein LOC132341370 isoform X2 [Haemorhous mexicanus]
MFSFLASQHRALPQGPPPREEEEDEVQLKPTRLELPMAMRFRHLKRTAKEAVGVYRSAIHGRGLFCKRNIEAGEMVIEYSGIVVRSVLTDKREKFYDSKGIGCYMFRIDEAEVVDATMHGSAARFINHSCEPNCYSRVIHVEGHKRIVIFALRRILRGEELTYDYKFPIEEPAAKLPATAAPGAAGASSTEPGEGPRGGFEGVGMEVWEDGEVLEVVGGDWEMQRGVLEEVVEVLWATRCGGGQPRVTEVNQESWRSIKSHRGQPRVLEVNQESWRSTGSCGGQPKIMAVSQEPKGQPRVVVVNQELGRSTKSPGAQPRIMEVNQASRWSTKHHGGQPRVMVVSQELGWSIQSCGGQPRIMVVNQEP